LYWRVADEAETLWDSDLYDAEILVERMGIEWFTTADIGALFDVARTTVGRWKLHGIIPAPAVPHRDGGRFDSHGDQWSRGQVARMLVDQAARGRRMREVVA